MKKGAIAIGSNSTRLLVAEKKNGMLTDIFRGREETRLFLGLDEQGMIAADRLEDTAQAVARLYLAGKLQGAGEMALFATSATRDAKNGGDLAKRIEELCHLKLQVITGEEEAKLAFRAVAGHESRLVMDIGGGSTEFTLGDQGEILFARSAQMGASRLLKMQAISSAADAEKALKIAEDALRPFVHALSAYPKAEKMTGLGGSCTTAAAIQMGKEAHGEGVEGKIISLAEAKRQLALLSSLPLEERMRVPGLPPARAVHMPHGLCILIAALQLTGHTEMTVSGRTNLDGYLLSLPE